MFDMRCIWILWWNIFQSNMLKWRWKFFGAKYSKIDVLYNITIISIQTLKPKQIIRAAPSCPFAIALHALERERSLMSSINTDIRHSRYFKNNLFMGSKYIIWSNEETNYICNLLDICGNIHENGKSIKARHKAFWLQCTEMVSVCVCVRQV